MLRRVYRWEIGSHQMISPVEKPMMMSMWEEFLVSWFTSWQRQCALVKRILIRYSACSDGQCCRGIHHHGLRAHYLTFVGDAKSSH